MGSWDPRVKIAHVVCADESFGIGRDNALPWHLPEDLKRFRDLTLSGVLLLGRKTYDSLPPQKLPGRYGVVLTKNSQFHTASNFTTAERLSDALDAAYELAAKHKRRHIFVIGGSCLYRHTARIVDEVYLTRVHDSFEVDARYPAAILENLFEVESGPVARCSTSGLDYSYHKFLRFRAFAR